MSKSRSRSPARRNSKKSRNYEDLDDKSRYCDLREKLNDLRRPKDNTGSIHITESRQSDSPKQKNTQETTKVQAIRSKRILKEAEVSVVMSEEDSDLEQETRNTENTETLSSIAKRFKSRSRTVSKESVSDNDTDTETKNETPTKSIIGEESENLSEKTMSIKSENRSRTGKFFLFI